MLYLSPLHHLLFASCAILAAVGPSVHQQAPAAQQQPPQLQVPSVLELSAPTNFPYYYQSPILPASQEPDLQEDQQSMQHDQHFIGEPAVRRTLMKMSNARKLEPLPAMPATPAPSMANKEAKCLYDRSYYSKLDECLSRKPYPTIGLPAFKNQDLLTKGGLLSEKHGCVFILNNGLFKNYQISKFNLENGDNGNNQQCFDGNSKVGLTMSFNNLTLSYLWTLRCLNRADQLLDDATLSGEASVSQKTPSICVGSSQNFGFASLQLSGLDAQVELASDIYKNWRVTNVTVAGSAGVPLRNSSTNDNNIDNSFSYDQSPFSGTNIRDYVFESLDGDELNWRYLHLFQNWSRNKIHSNFYDQYRRFLWISIQRCLTEGSEKLPAKLVDIFANQRFS